MVASFAAGTLFGSAGGTGTQPFCIAGIVKRIVAPTICVSIRFMSSITLSGPEWFTFSGYPNGLLTETGI
jgi:hypothetical protein